MQRFCEQVIGSTSNRGDFRKIAKSNIDVDLFGKEVVEAYHSSFMFDESIIEYIAKHNSFRGYDGPVYTDAMYFDFDNESIHDAYSDTTEVIDRLFDMGYTENNFRIYYSGNKGFHLFVLSQDFRSIRGRQDVPMLMKHVCSQIAGDLESFDPSVYDRTRIIRATNSKHGKSGLYKIPLTYEEFYGNSIEDIIEIAKTQKKQNNEDVWVSNELVIGFIRSFKPEEVSKERKTDCNTLINGILDGFGTGMRNNGITSLAGILHSRNFDADLAHAILTVVNERSDDPLPDSDIATIMNSVSRYKINPDYEKMKPKDIITMGEAKDKWIDLRKRSIKISTNFELMDKETWMFDPGQVMMIAARAGVGKTSLGMQYANMLASSLSGKCLFASLEMNSPTIFFRAAQMTANQGDDELTNEEIAHLLLSGDDLIKKTINDWNNILIIDKDSLSLEQIEAYFNMANEMTDGLVKVLMIDYVGLIRGADDYKGLSAVARNLKSLSKRLNTRIILVAQLSRRAGDGTYEVRMDHLRDSGALEEAADYIIGMWQSNGDTKRIHASMLKNRYGIRGSKFDFINNGLNYTNVKFDSSHDQDLIDTGRRDWSS